MTRPEMLFTPQQLAMMQTVVGTANKGLWAIQLIIISTVIYCALQALVGTVEWELMFRVFEYLAGEGYQFFSPRLMAFTGVIMIIGYHLLAKSQPNNIAVVAVNRISQLFILAYALGAGLYLANILIESGLGESGVPDIDAMLGGLETLYQQSWLEKLFSNVAGPIGALILAVAIGGLGTVNLYISHVLISNITENIVTIRDRLSHHKSVQKDYKTVLRCQNDYAEATGELAELDMMDQQYISLQIATDTLKTISHNLSGHEQEYQRMLIEPEDPQFGPPRKQADLKEIKKSIEAIKKISLGDILKVLNAPQLQEKPL